MSIKAEEIVGIGVIAFLLWWIWDHKNSVAASQPNAITYNAPSFPASKIQLPVAPNLNFITNQATPTINNYNVVMPTLPATTPAPCACSACDEGGNASITQTVQGFVDSITKSLGAAYDTYVANAEQVLTPLNILTAFAGSSAAKANADLVTSAQQAAQNNGTGVSLTVGSVTYSQQQEQKDFANIAGINGPGTSPLQRAGNITLASLNQYTPGRVVTLVAG